jgi:hypothetical protein
MPDNMDYKNVREQLARTLAEDPNNYEVINWRISEIDFERRIIHIRQSKCKINHISQP